MKKRKQKHEEYEQMYSEIPRDMQQRLYWMYDKMHLSDSKQKEIIEKRDRLLRELSYTELFIILYEEPEGAPRPRFRLVNRKNLSNVALSNSQFVHVYSITGEEDNKFMKRLVTEQDILSLDRLVHTPCQIEFTAFFKTPKGFNQVDTFLAEIGCIDPITKPDWDNLGKKYSDMYNANIWLDDALVTKGTVIKKYSILPRVEIRLLYMNMLYNKYQYNMIAKRVDHEVLYFK